MIWGVQGIWTRSRGVYGGSWGCLLSSWCTWDVLRAVVDPFWVSSRGGRAVSAASSSRLRGFTVLSSLPRPGGCPAGGRAEGKVPGCLRHRAGERRDAGCGQRDSPVHPYGDVSGEGGIPAPAPRQGARTANVLPLAKLEWIFQHPLGSIPTLGRFSSAVPIPTSPTPCGQPGSGDMEEASPLPLPRLCPALLLPARTPSLLLGPHASGLDPIPPAQTPSLRLGPHPAWT